MDKEQQKEISYLAGSILGPCILAAIIAAGSPNHNCCSFMPELLMIIIPGAYCFYALRSIVDIRLRSALLIFALISAIAVLTVAKTVPRKTSEEENKENAAKTELKDGKLHPNDNKGQQPDFKSLSSAFKQGFK